MNSYDFSKLNDKEFEFLSIDLLSKTEGLRIEKFKAGKDKGVDGRFFSANKDEVIIQCKHWNKSGISKLISELKNKELNKINALSPKRYILTTSLDLSRKNKQDISKILKPYLLEADIFGKNDITDLISQNLDIEQKHYKLWLTSSSILISMLNSAMIGRSVNKLDEIQQLSSKYVATSNYEKAIKRLEDIRCIIITGEPGIGKTTLADQLCLHYAKNEFEICCLSDSVSEAESLFKKEAKQLFYFDDFLGRNYLEALNRHEDSEIINFIKRVTNDASKRFVLTSRTVILNRGKSLSDLFKINNIDRNEYEIELNSLSIIDKARILYNHIWFSSLDEAHIEKIYEDKRYKKIIKHRNYNPRLVSFITDSYKISDVKPCEYWDYIQNTLDKPKNIWAHLFNNQINDAVKILVYLTALNGKEINESELKNSFADIAIKENISSNSKIENDFRISIEIAVKALLKRNIDNLTKNITYDLFNPSIGDFVIETICKDYVSLQSYFKCLNTVQSLNSLENLKNAKIIDKDIFSRILKKLVTDKLNTNDESNREYKIRLAYLAINHLLESDNINYELDKFLHFFITVDVQSCITEVCDLYVWYVKTQKITSDGFSDLFQYINVILGYALDRDEYAALYKLAKEISCHCVISYEFPKKTDWEIIEDIIKNIEKKFLEHLKETIHDQVVKKGMLEEYYSLDSDDGYPFEMVCDFISDILWEYNFEFDQDDISSIAECCDISQIIRDNADSLREEETRYDAYKEQRDTTSVVLSEDAVIDDLFDNWTKQD